MPKTQERPKVDQLELTTDPVESAKAAGLRYVSDASPGIQRKRSGKGFSYIDLDGRPIRDRQKLQRLKSLGIPPAYTDVWVCPDPNGHLQATGRDAKGRKQYRSGKGFSYIDLDGRPIRDRQKLQRLKSLGIPPAYTDVWVCPNPNGHLQATGRDAKGRKQYRYHPRWRAARDETKYTRMLAFGEALPLIRKRIQQDLARPGLSKQKVLATVVRLLETTLIRVGNEEYAKENRSFGLTTMRDRHVDISGSTVQFQFRGKRGKQHTIDIQDRRLAKIVKRCQDIPGYELFQYFDQEGQRQTVDSGDVNEYLRDIAGQDFTAKDFRTWAGTVFATLALQEFEAFDTKTQARKNVVRAIETVAERLGNTPSICRKCYVHPEVIEAYLDGTLIHTLKQRTEQELEESLHELRPEEAAVMTFLQQRLAREEA